MAITFPDGLRPVLATPPPLTQNRLTRFTYELLTNRGAPLGDLEGVQPTGSLTWDYSTKIKTGGKITVVDTGQVIDWLNVRVKIGIEVNGEVWSLGVYLPTAPDEQWDEGHRLWDVELHDKLTVLEEDAVTETFVLDAGTVVTTAVVDLIRSTGETAISVTESDKTLAAPRVWEAGTSKLDICNDLLDSAGYFTLRTNGTGQYVIRPYVAPHLRTLRYTFEDTVTGIYSPLFTHAQDVFKVPNRVIAVQQGTDTEPALTAVAENNDPTSPYSFVNRGRWIALVFTGVEATDQDALDTYARSQLVDGSRVTAGVKLTHAPIPLDLYDAVQFVSVPAGIDARFVIDKTEMTLDPTALAGSYLRQVVTYESS